MDAIPLREEGQEPATIRSSNKIIRILVGILIFIFGGILLAFSLGIGVWYSFLYFSPAPSRSGGAVGGIHFTEWGCVKSIEEAWEEDHSYTWAECGRGNCGGIDVRPNCNQLIRVK